MGVDFLAFLKTCVSNKSTREAATYVLVLISPFKDMRNPGRVSALVMLVLVDRPRIVVVRLWNNHMRPMDDLTLLLSLETQARTLELGWELLGVQRHYSLCCRAEERSLRSSSDRRPPHVLS